MMIGKTFWKCIVLPSVLLSGGSVLVWTKVEMEKLRVDNSFW